MGVDRGTRAARYLYLARHAEALPDESGLSENGRRQARLLGERLRDVPLSAIHHGPLARAAQTARIIHDQRCDGERPPGEHPRDVLLQESEKAGDYLPYLPVKEELPPDVAERMLGFLTQFTDDERDRGPGLAKEAVASFTGPVEGEVPRHELVVTHNFLVAWLVRDALDAPAWRWMGLNHGNAALTVIRYAPGRPSSVLVLNDTRHLPEELRWTGFPPEIHV